MDKIVLNDATEKDLISKISKQLIQLEYLEVFASQTLLWNTINNIQEHTWTKEGCFCIDASHSATG